MALDLGPRMRPGWSNDPRILVDPEDEWLLGYKWYLHRDYDRNLYAARRVPLGSERVVLRMHRVIMDAAPDALVDHINGNGLDNRRCNLRFATRTENQCNRRLTKTNASGYKGVRLHRQSGKWSARIRLDGRVVSLGYFCAAEEAAHAYDRAAIELFGEFAKTNAMLGLYAQEVRS